jgi:hypothetical protein
MLGEEWIEEDADEPGDTPDGRGDKSDARARAPSDLRPEWPGVEPPDVEHGDIDALIEAYPDYRAKIRAFTDRG